MPEVAEKPVVKKDAGSLTLPMPCYYPSSGEWKPGTIVHFISSAMGLFAIVKPDHCNRFESVDLLSVEHGTIKPEGRCPKR